MYGASAPPSGLVEFGLPQPLAFSTTLRRLEGVCAEEAGTKTFLFTAMQSVTKKALSGIRL